MLIPKVENAASPPLIPQLKDAVCLSQAARLWLPKARSGKSVHPSVLSRWSDRGLLARNGKRVYLSTWYVGGQRQTTRAAIETLLAALNEDSTTAVQDSADAAVRRSRESAAALEKLGC